MRDKKGTQPLSTEKRTATASADDLLNNLIDGSVEDQELRAALQHWGAPSAPESLNRRVLAAYRREVKRAPLWRRRLTAYLPILSLWKRGYEEANMKQCVICFEEFTEKFSFCPVDGAPLNGFAPRAASLPFDSPSPGFGEHQTAHAPQLAGAGGGYHLTIIEDAGLARRLTTELREVARDAQLTWPELKRDPIGFTKRSASAYALLLQRFFSSPNVAIATMTAILVMLTAVVGFVALDRYRVAHSSEMARNRDDLQLIEMMTEIPADQPEPEEGTAGLSKGKGGGSKPKQEKPGGGGGGGRKEQKQASLGKVAEGSLTVPPIVAPNPKPPAPTKDPLLVTPTLDADPLLIPRDDRPIPYGDNKSTSTDPSSGPGMGGGIGTGEGVGIGAGQGGGYGPGRDGNMGGGNRHLGGGGPGGPGGGKQVDYDKVFKGSEVTSKIRILSKPEPPYTEAARKHQITGTVILQAVFSASGQVTDIRPVSGLPHGLTEKAIAAARQIKFVPAQKDGRPVSMYYRIEYNFNLY